MSNQTQKISSPKKLSEALKKEKKAKKFIAGNHRGKVQWNEDPVEYQRKLRDEWD